MKDLSLYIHIPFCKSKCNYCDFLSFDNEDKKIENYINALNNEIKNYSELTKGYQIKSIFIGGGTPSILSCNQLSSILLAIKKYYDIDKNAEITIEANPGTLTLEKIETILRYNVNRVSVGLQSCNNIALKKLGRIHTLEEFLLSYELLRNTGVKNINIDLMFALPNQTIKELESDLNNIIKLNPEHISCYGLIIEEGTLFNKLYNDNKLFLPNEEIERDMYWLVHNILEENHYKHYEISNFAKKGKECYHNTVYWKELEYIGIGLGASSYFNGYRYKNISDINNYIQLNGEINLLKEDIQKIDKLTSIEEYMFLGLRLLDGINKQEFNERWGGEVDLYYKEVIKELTQKKLLYEDAYRVKLTEKGIDISNVVLSNFLLDKS
jgi:oxygen-independent coproporphyrinogen-3 oxidase